MSEFVTVTKIFIMSLLILVLLQMKWNGTSLEKRAVISLHQSHIGQTIEDVAMGATKLIEKGYAWTKETLAKTTQKTPATPGSIAPQADSAASR
jgi:L-cystine uptake protein TcyP (sodium:dicarboxylate symporter family)